MVDFTVILCITMGIATLWEKLDFNSRLIPLVNVVVSMLLSLILMNELTFLFRLQQGLVIGLSASGVYDVCASLMKE